MSRYHVNPLTGKASVCQAEIKCRLGGEHYDTEAEAYLAYEKTAENEFNVNYHETKQSQLYTSLPERKNGDVIVIDDSLMNNYQNDYLEFYDTCTETENNTLHEYVEPHTEINEKIHNGNLNFEDYNKISVLNAALSKAPLKDKVVYRRTVDGENAENLQPGDKMTTSGFLSTTINPNSIPQHISELDTDAIVFEIQTDKGAPISGYSYDYEDEYEYCLPQHVQFECVGRAENVTFIQNNNGEQKRSSVTVVQLKEVKGS